MKRQQRAVYLEDKPWSTTKGMLSDITDEEGYEKIKRHADDIGGNGQNFYMR